MQSEFRFAPVKDWSRLSPWQFRQYGKEQLGISISPQGKVYITRRRYGREGKQYTDRQTFSHLRKAVRSQRHVIDGIFAQAKVNREQMQTLSGFWKVLRRTDLPAEEHKQLVWEKYQEANKYYSQRRRPRPRQGRELMRKRADDKADVQALLDNNNWGAICAVLVYRLRPDMPRENQEILSSLRFQLVRWDFIRCEWSRQHHQLLNLKLQTTDLGEALAAARQPKGKDYAIKAVTRIICSYERRALQYHWLKGAKTALVHLRVSLECAGRFNQDGEKKYRAALGRLNAFRTWLGDGPEDKVGEQPRLLAG